MAIRSSERVLNATPEPKDPRDFRALTTASFRLKTPATLAPVYNFESKCPPNPDQGRLGTCVSNATAMAVLADILRQGSHAISGSPSRLFLNYNVHKMEGTLGQDNGIYIRDAFKSLNVDGVCSETDWPYIETQEFRKPSRICYKRALGERSLSYASVDNRVPLTVKTVLSFDYPIVFGFYVYDSFLSDEVARTGIVPMPDLSKETVQGGHCMRLVGWDDNAKTYNFANSWGQDWGRGGFGSLPAQFFEDPNQTFDCWVVTQVK